MRKVIIGLLVVCGASYAFADIINFDSFQEAIGNEVLVKDRIERALLGHYGALLDVWRPTSAPRRCLEETFPMRGYLPREKVIEARLFLAIPANLTNVYKRYKDVAVRLLRDMGHNATMYKQVLQRNVLPYFSMTAETKCAVEKYQAAKKKAESTPSWESIRGQAFGCAERVTDPEIFRICAGGAQGTPFGEMVNEYVPIILNYKEKFEARGVSIPTYEFFERRRAEGGDRLISAWEEILRDFTESL